MDFKSVSPKVWGAVIVGGIGLGLLLRKRSKGGGSASAPAATGADLSTYGLANSSTGAYAGSQMAGSYAGTNPTASGAGGSFGIIPSVTQDLQDAITGQVVDRTRQVIAGIGSNPANPTGGVSGTGTSGTVAPPAANSDPLAPYYGKFVNILRPDGGYDYFAVYGPGNIVNEDLQHVQAHPDRVTVTDPNASTVFAPFLGRV